jgi:hypothetical protein
VTPSRYLALLVAVASLAAAPAAAAHGPVIALLAVENAAGDGEATRHAGEALAGELGAWTEVVAAGATRDALRRLRVRSADDASPAVLADLAADLGADWLVSLTVHDAERRDVPRLTLSARAYLGGNGEIFWAGFTSVSGLDGRTVLGLGAVTDLEKLIPRAVGRLVRDLESATPAPAARGSLGTLALVPFAGDTTQRATAHGVTLTEAARAAAFRRGVPLTSPNCDRQALRRVRSTRRGAVDATMRQALVEECGADSILTGSVTAYDIGGAELEPEPRVSLDLRLLDARTGRILWLGAAQRRGWDHPGLFRLGRIYSRGALAQQLMDRLTRQFLERAERTDHPEAR